MSGEVEAIGRFGVLRALGAGGMGVVYEGEDPKLGRRVALKLMPVGARTDAERTARFLREARAAATVTHPNVVVVYEVGQDSEHGPYLAMEYVRGGSLREAIREGVSSEKAVAIARDVAAGLAAAHDAGLVPRDLKPENVLIASDGTAKVADFGLAKAFGPAGESNGEAPTTPGEVLTEEGTMLGSPGYMAPEQARGGPVDARTDVYALGVVLYERCAGRRPFTGPTPMAEVVASIADDPPDLRILAPSAPAGLVALTHRCLSRDPTDRPADGREVLRDLESVASGSGAPIDPDAATMAGPAIGRPPERPPRAWVVPAVLVALAVAAIGLWANRPQEAPTVAAIGLWANRPQEAPTVAAAPEPSADGDTEPPPAAESSSETPSLLPPRGQPASDPRGPLFVPCGDDAEPCAEGQSPWCDRDSTRVACCAPGLVPAGAEGICACPPGGTLVMTAHENGCELASAEGLSLASLRSVVSAAHGELRECYEPVTAEHPEGRGRVVLRFVVSAHGDVFDVSIEGSSLPFPEVQRCLLRELATLRFPPPGGGAPIMVSYPVDFAAH